MNSDAFSDANIEKVTYIVGMICSGMSLAAISALYILYFLRPRSTGNVFFRMVIHMELPNALYAITGFITHPEQVSENFCAFSGAIRQFSLLSTSLWTLAISFHIKNSISEHQIRPFSRIYYLFAYGLSLPFALLPLLFDLYEQTPIYCGIPFHNLFQNLVIYYIPILTVLFGTCYCYFSMIRYLWKAVSKEAAQEFYPLLIYPFLVVIYNIGSFIYLILDLSGPSMTLGRKILILITTGILQAQGMFDVLVYSMNYAIREEIKLKLCPHKMNEMGSEFDPNFKSRMSTVEVINRRFSTLLRGNPTTSNLVASDLSPYRNMTHGTV